MKMINDYIVLVENIKLMMRMTMMRMTMMRMTMMRRWMMMMRMMMMAMMKMARRRRRRLLTYDDENEVLHMFCNLFRRCEVLLV